jgi:hypothetical protein
MRRSTGVESNAASPTSQATRFRRGTRFSAAEGFDPVPPYEELVTDYGKSPYCARLVRDETWF